MYNVTVAYFSCKDWFHVTCITVPQQAIVPNGLLMCVLSSEFENLNDADQQKSIASGALPL